MMIATHAIDEFDPEGNTGRYVGSREREEQTLRS